MRKVTASPCAAALTGVSAPCNRPAHLLPQWAPDQTLLHHLSAGRDCERLRWCPSHLSPGLARPAESLGLAILAYRQDGVGALRPHVAHTHDQDFGMAAPPPLSRPAKALECEPTQPTYV